MSDEREANVGDLTRGLFRDAAPLDERITEAIRRITHGCGSMRIPAEATDPDIVLGDCRSEIAALRTRVEALTRDLDAATKALVETLTYGEFDIVRLGDYCAVDNDNHFAVIGPMSTKRFDNAQEAIAALLAAERAAKEPK